ncbi:MAG: YdcF family protein [Acidimicrobiales bacterium]|nr:YdcF family protein [Acidimicrobiales bacterium]
MTDPTPERGGAETRGPVRDEPPPRRRRRRRWVRGALAVVVVMAVYVTGTFIQVWQASGRDGQRRAEAIVVLGAAQYDGRPSPALEGRLDHALALYRRGLAPLIVVTGGRQQGDRFTEATAGYNYLRNRGVPDRVILKEVQGRTTYESLAAVARFLDAKGIDDVLLVSGPAHTKRLSGIAGQVGLRAAVSPADGTADGRTLLRETIAVSAGRLIGYRRLERLDR